eukprot:gene29572-33392_t
MIGAEARAYGFNVLLAGGVNLMREPRNGRNFEYAGEDPLLAGVMVGEQVRGIQSNRIVATVKHFAYNGQETNRFTVDSELDDAGRRTYVAVCAGCHGLDGGGKPHAAVALKGNTSVRSADAHNLIAVTLDGIRAQHFGEKESMQEMPGFAGKLSDKEVADLSNYMRASWGGGARVLWFLKYLQMSKGHLFTLRKERFTLWNAVRLRVNIMLPWGGISFHKMESGFQVVD